MPTTLAPARPPIRASRSRIAQLDTANFDPTGADLLRFDPLAPAEPATAAPCPFDPAAAAEPSGRAAIQVGLLRHSLDSAIRLDNALAQQVERSNTAKRDLDRRLIAAGSAVGVLERATSLLHKLEALVSQLHAADAAAQCRVNQRLEAHQAALEQPLAALQSRFEQRAAEIERSASASVARVSLLLDDSQQQLADLEAQSTRIGAAARDRIERACEAAAAVLGHDPRAADASRPTPGSLADFVARAESAADHADQAALRLNALTERSTQAAVSLETSVESARRFDESQASLRDSLARNTDSESRLASLRDDLESVAASARYNLSQAQQAEASLLRAEQQASSRVDRLDRAMQDATDHARNLVQVARDVGGLIVQAEQLRRDLGTHADTDAAPAPAQSVAPPRSASRAA